MSTRTLAAAALLLALVGCSTLDTAPPWGCPLPPVEGSVLVLPAGEHVHGTGWVVAPGRVVTAAHVAAVLTSAPDLAVHPQRDLAALSVPWPGPPLALGEAPLVGAPVWALGFASAGGVRHLVRTAGHWQGVDADGDAWISAPVHPGGSGGPVVDCEGRVVGVVQGMGTAPMIGLFPGASAVAHLGLVIPVVHVRELVP